jgi:AcrR family transcriptional regulator
LARGTDPGKRERIIEAAQSEFLEDGYEGARMSAIAGRAGIAVGTVYLYFDSKEAVAGALTDRFFEKISSKVVPMLSDLSSRDRIGEIVDSALEIAAEERELFRTQQLPERAARSFRFEVADVFARRISEQTASGHLDVADAQVTATLLITLIERTIYECLVWETGDLERYRKTLKRMFERTLS